MAVKVRIPGSLRSQTGGVTEVSVQGATVAEALRGLEAALPGLASVLRDEGGNLRPIVNVYVNDEHVRYRQGLQTPLREGDLVFVVPTIMGG
jgi:molybdopterin synthase sulfur carrier subunit